MVYTSRTYFSNICYAPKLKSSAFLILDWYWHHRTEKLHHMTKTWRTEKKRLGPFSIHQNKHLAYIWLIIYLFRVKESNSFQNCQRCLSKLSSLSKTQFIVSRSKTIACFWNMKVYFAFAQYVKQTSIECHFWSGQPLFSLSILSKTFHE